MRYAVKQDRNGNQMKLSDLVPASMAARKKGVKILIYGKAGCGKTPLLATAPAPVILSTEGGLLSLANSDVPVYVSKSFDDTMDFLKWWISSDESRRFQTLCIDSLSEMTTQCLNALDKDTSIKSKLQVYGKLAESIYRVVSKLHDEDDRNIVCLAKIGKSLNEDGVETFRPMFEGSKLESLIPHKFDEILYMKDGKLHTRENPYFHARDRSGKLNEQEEANLTQIITKLT